MSASDRVLRLIHKKVDLSQHMTLNRYREEYRKMHVTIYTDGAARGNPNGPGGYAAILEYTDPRGILHTRECFGAYEKTTNNRMELLAAIVGLEALNRPCDVDLYSDSKYLVDAFNSGWVDGWLKKNWKKSDGEPVKNIPLWQRLLKAKEPHTVVFHWVKGHAGHPQNERCDQLASAAADEGPWLSDDGLGDLSEKSM